MKHIALIFKGMLFGIANLIPGVSGGTMAIVTGVYEKLLDSINNLFKKFKASIIFLLLFGLGAVIAVLAGAKVLEWGLKYFKLPISLLFIGLIVGSLPTITKPIKNQTKPIHYLFMVLAFALVIGLLYIPFPEVVSGSLQFYDYLLLVVCGFLASIAMVVPGISGMMMFYIFGYYETIMTAISGLIKFTSFGSSFLILLPVGIGVIIGIFAIIYEGGLVDEFISCIGFTSLGEYFSSASTYLNGRIFYKWAELLITAIFFLTGLFGSMLLVQLSNNKEKEEAETKRLVDEKREKMRPELIEEINNSRGGSND